LKVSHLLNKNRPLSDQQRMAENGETSYVQ